MSTNVSRAGDYSYRKPRNLSVAVPVVRDLFDAVASTDSMPELSSASLSAFSSSDMTPLPQRTHRPFSSQGSLPSLQSAGSSHSLHSLGDADSSPSLQGGMCASSMDDLTVPVMYAYNNEPMTSETPSPRSAGSFNAGSLFYIPKRRNSSSSLFALPNLPQAQPLTPLDPDMQVSQTVYTVVRTASQNRLDQALPQAQMMVQPQSPFPQQHPHQQQHVQSISVSHTTMYNDGRSHTPVSAVFAEPVPIARAVVPPFHVARPVPVAMAPPPPPPMKAYQAHAHPQQHQQQQMQAAAASHTPQFATWASRPTVSIPTMHHVQADVVSTPQPLSATSTSSSISLASGTHSPNTGRGRGRPPTKQFLPDGTIVSVKNRYGSGQPRKRRKATDLSDKEKWNCPFGCGKFYRKTSTRSVQRHPFECPLRPGAAAMGVASADVYMMDGGGTLAAAPDTNGGQVFSSMKPEPQPYAQPQAIFQTMTQAQPMEATAHTVSTLQRQDSVANYGSAMSASAFDTVAGGESKWSCPFPGCSMSLLRSDSFGIEWHVQNCEYQTNHSPHSHRPCSDTTNEMAADTPTDMDDAVMTSFDEIFEGSRTTTFSTFPSMEGSHFAATSGGDTKPNLSVYAEDSQYAALWPPASPALTPAATSATEWTATPRTQFTTPSSVQTPSVAATFLDHHVKLQSNIGSSTTASLSGKRKDPS